MGSYQLLEPPLDFKFQNSSSHRIATSKRIGFVNLDGITRAIAQAVSL
jgi:hypothetical protein